MFRLESIGIALMILFVCINLISNRDMLPSLMPLMLCGIFTMVHRQESDYFWLVWLAIPIIASFVFHLLYYPTKFSIKNAKMFYSMLAVAIAVTLGGLFSISAKDYFHTPGIFYVIGLGFGMLAVFIFCDMMINPNEKYDIKTYLPNMMTAIAIMMFIMLLTYYLTNLDYLFNCFNGFLKNLYWGNNLSHSLLLTMPFAFYMATKDKHTTFYFTMGIIEYACLILDLSRGGMLFGTIMFPICVITTFLKNKKDRKKFFIISLIFFFIGLIVVIIKWDVILSQLNSLLEFDQNVIRINLYKSALENFINNPLFGAGISFRGDCYLPSEGSMYWYHSTPFQIIGSLGLLGWFAYSYQFFDRLEIFKAKKDDFNLYIFFSFLGFELYSLVNVGDFFPFPFVMILTEFFVILNKTNKMKDISNTK
jgi:hypothetical protein